MADPINLPAATMLLDEARRMLNDQYSALESLRGRAVALLSVGSLVAALFGSRLPMHLTDAAHRSVMVALGAFALSVVIVAWVVFPRKLKFSHSLVGQFPKLDKGRKLRTYDLAVTWAKGYETDRAFNEAKIQNLMVCFTVACGLLAVQVVAWGIAVTR